MPKTKTERNTYCREWRKKIYEQGRFNKVVCEYVEVRYTNVMIECKNLYQILKQTHPDSKDLTKTKTFKRWKKEQLSLTLLNKQSIQPQPNKQSIESQPNEQSIEPQPNEQSIEPQPNEQSIEPQPNEQSIEPQPNEQSVEPQPNEQSIEPQPNEQSIEPQPNEQSVEPQSNEQSIEPQPNEQSIESFPNILNQVVNEFNIDQISEQIQSMIEDLQQDPDIRALLNNEGLFPPYQEDEGIALDIESEIDNLYDPIMEDPFW